MRKDNPIDKPITVRHDIKLASMVQRTRAKEAHCVSGGRNWRMSFQE